MADMQYVSKIGRLYFTQEYCQSVQNWHEILFCRNLAKFPRLDRVGDRTQKLRESYRKADEAEHRSYRVESLEPHHVSRHI